MLVKLQKCVFLVVLASLLFVGIVPVQAQDNTNFITLSFSDLGYGDFRLKGLYGAATAWIPFQSDWPVESVEVQLTYAASPLLNSQEAILTVLANDQELVSIRPIGDGQDHTFSFVVPLDRLLQSGVNLTFDGHLRLTDEFCEDSFNTGQWLIVRNTSLARVNLSGMSPIPQLIDLPQAIVVQDGNKNVAPITFVLPDEVDNLTLTAASQVAARLGTGITPDNLPIQVVSISNLTQQQKDESNLVVLGTPDNQPLIRELANFLPVPISEQGFQSEDGLVIPFGDGVVQIFNSPWRSRGNILLIGGNDGTGLAMAGQAFVDEATFRSMAGSFQFIHSLVKNELLNQAIPWNTPKTTFGQLGEADRQITGLGITDSYYFFQYPPGVMLEEGARLMLHVAFSPALRAQNSYAVVSINDVYVGAVNVNPVDGDTWVALDLPVRALNELARVNHSRKMDVKFSIANLLPTNNCQQVDKNSSWTKIYSDSYFQTNFSFVSMPDLYFFPYPFVSANNNDPVTFVIPENPNISELRAVLSTAALLGQGAVANLNIDVKRAVAETPKALAGHQVILFGTPSRNPLMGDVLKNIQDTVPVDVYQVLGMPNVGFFHETVSPWDETKNVLVIYGDADAGFDISVDALYKYGRIVDESGSVALIRPDEKPVVIYREAGLPQPEIVNPDIILSETGSQDSQLLTPVVSNSPSVNNQSDTAGLTGTERLILIITVLLVILIAVAALVRIAWRIRP